MRMSFDHIQEEELLFSHNSQECVPRGGEKKTKNKTGTGCSNGLYQLLSAAPQPCHLNQSLCFFCFCEQLSADFCLFLLLRETPGSRCPTAGTFLDHHLSVCVFVCLNCTNLPVLLFCLHIPRPNLSQQQGWHARESALNLVDSQMKHLKPQAKCSSLPWWSEVRRRGCLTDADPHTFGLAERLNGENCIRTNGADTQKKKRVRSAIKPSPTDARPVKSC